MILKLWISFSVKSLLSPLYCALCSALCVDQSSLISRNTRSIIKSNILLESARQLKRWHSFLCDLVGATVRLRSGLCNLSFNAQIKTKQSKNSIWLEKSVHFFLRLINFSPTQLTFTLLLILSTWCQQSFINFPEHHLTCSLPLNSALSRPFLSTLLAK